jgi:hypothetical protein
MPYTTTYDFADDIIVTKLSGIVTLDIIRDGLEDIMRLSIEHNCFRWLNDFSDSILNVPIHQLFSYAESVPVFLEKIGNKKFMIRRAIVKNKQSDSFSFFENASVNRGVNTKVFTDAESARKWLLG